MHQNMVLNLLAVVSSVCWYSVGKPNMLNPILTIFINKVQGRILFAFKNCQVFEWSLA